jgi:molybdenum cofactor biosynthesis enzyme MoaA
MIRRSTGKGVIHMNTNASKPKALDALYDAGLDSIRVSMNSVRPVYYTRYYKPRGYSFKDVARSIANAKRRGVFVSLNYLTMPGFTDSKDEFHALTHFLEDHKIDMIQWRNLNYDPAEYFRVLRCHPRGSEILGIRNIMHILRNRFPRLRHGYFNPAYSVMAY